VKEQQAKQRKKVIISKGGNESMKQRQRQPQHHDRRTTQHPQRIPDPIQKQPRNIDRKEIPRAFLTQTASTNVYIAKCAVIDEISGEMYVDPKTLFSEIVSYNNIHKTKAPHS
jgi:hypothetical protein